ncbi:MAG: 3-hydroxy-3-methylglutaryl-CoA reductase, partial [candidate division KSB1 bacterium]|nr:3-hydroxy-3-methylglutaryl-CoA reductase [candidate division KSB1 bacterium]
MEKNAKKLTDMKAISVNGKSSRFPGFYKHDLSFRLDLLEQWYPLTTKEKWMLKRETLTPELADIMVENAIGVFGLPLGVAVNLKLNDRDYIVPMAVEESSVIAALSNSARLVRDHGKITAEASEPIMFSQVQLVDVKHPQKAKRRILAKKEDLLRVANEQDPVLVELGGGAKDIEVRIINSLSGPMVIVHIIVDCRDAMGANVVNTMAETLAPILAELAEGDAICKIVSNLSDRRMVHVRMEIAVEALARAGFSGEQAADRIVKAYHFAEA